MASARWKEGLRLKAANLVAYSLFSVAVVRTGAILPWYPYGDLKQTYITPGVWASFAWPIIYFTLLGTIIYQFTSAHAKAVVIDGILWRCPIMILLGAITVTVWENHNYIIAFVSSLFLFLMSTFNYGLIKARYPTKSVGDELFVHMPFSIWQGWASIIVVCTAFEAFGIDATKHHDGAWTKAFVFLALCFLVLVALLHALTPDLYGTLVLSSTMWAIFDHQRSPFIHHSALAFFIMSIFWIVVAMHGVYHEYASAPAIEQYGPLLGS